MIRQALPAVLALLVVAIACRSDAGPPPPAPKEPAPVAPAPQPAPPPPQQPAPPAQQPAAEAQPEEPGADEKKKEEEEEDEDRRGIPVTSALVVKHCATCHQDRGEGKLGRISYMRKTPEGWELSLKRMIRLQHLAMTPEEAKEIVRYLANDHGLARAESERAMYEVERRIHWSEDQADKELRTTCGECHTLGRVLSERRDEKEWKLLKATHLAFFPLARWQAFRGEDNEERIDWESMSEAEAEEAWERRQQSPKVDAADRVLAKLAHDLPLVTPEWDAWTVNRRSVPVAGTWDVVGHEPARGDLRGHVTIAAIAGDPEAYETEWEIAYPDGKPIVRRGKGILYAGYSWRGRSQAQTADEPPELREVLLLSEDWNDFTGRIFTGEYNEIGVDVRLHRRTRATAIHATKNPAVMIPSLGHPLELEGEGFPADLAAADFSLGAGITVTSAIRLGDDRVKLTVDTARSARRGARAVSFRAVQGPADVVLYDTVDYVRVSPEQGLARVGGKMRPPQIERFEAIAMNRGADDEPYTADDYAVRVVPARWKLEEFPVREGDDDARFVGQIDPVSGVFTPAIDGPNPDRKWSANNIGEVFVVATCSMVVRDIPPKKKGAPPPEVPAEEEPIVLVAREYTARGHLLVMVPIYVQWDRYVWDQR